MDSGCDFIMSLNRWIASLDEDFIIGISNKGIYNRAIKDLEGVQDLNVSMNGSELVCTLPDGNRCTLVNDIKKCLLII